MAMMATPRRDNLRGIGAMLFAVAMFALMDTGLKLLSAHYPSLQVAALRAISSLPLVVAYVVWRGESGRVWRVRWPLHLLRGLLGIGMLAAFAHGLRALPLAEAYSIFFVAPMLITGLSVPLLGERVEAARWIAIAIGMLGVVVVLRPTGAGLLTGGGLAVLASAACYALSAVLVRILGRTDSSESMVLWLMVVVAIGAGLLAAPGWVPVRLEHGWILAGLAVTGFLGQIAVTEAFRRGEASAIAPFEYSALAWGIALDWALWRVLPDRYTLLGAAIIVGSGIIVLRRERGHTEAEHP
jgi:drug/metabolite transporter (DMT)-like permease